MKIRLYNFNKKLNSTKTPDGLDYREVDAVLLEYTSIERPEITLDFLPNGYNYAYIVDFSRYYFIDSYDYETNNRYRIYLTIDVLATYKDKINNSTQFVERSASVYNKWIKDDNAVISKEAVISSTTKDIGLDFVVGGKIQGTFLTKVQVKNPIVYKGASDGAEVDGHSPGGNFMIYALSPTQLAGYIRALSDPNNYAVGSKKVTKETKTKEDGTSETITTELEYINASIETAQSATNNAFNYIVSCYWVPFNSSALNTGYARISAGWLDFENVSGGLGANSAFFPAISTFGKTLNFEYDLNYNDWSEADPALNAYYLYIPSYGYYHIDNNKFKNKIVVDIGMDYLTALTTIILSDSNGNTIEKLNGNLGVNMQLGGYTLDTQTLRNDYYTSKNEMVSFTANAVNNAVSLLDSVKSRSAGGIVNAISDTLAASQSANMQLSIAQSNAKTAYTFPISSVIGNAGSWADILTFYKAQLLNIKYNVSYDYNEFIGRPLYTLKRLGDLSGYCQTSTGNIEDIKLVTEREEVNRLLTTGIYLE